MHLPEKGRIEWNLNTIVMLVGFLAGFIAWGATWGTFSTRVELNDKRFEDWTIRHEGLHRERQAQAASNDARTDQRLTQLDIETRKIENLGYRVTVAEQAGITTSKSIERLQETVNQQSTDIRVMREIIENQFGAKPRR